MADGAPAPLPTAEPEWLSERRRRGAERAAELELPTQKAKGWEFTDLSTLDLDAYAEPNGAGADGAEAAERAVELIAAPEGSVRVRQVDATALDAAASDAAVAAGAPTDPIVLPLSVVV